MFLSNKWLLNQPYLAFRFQYRLKDDQKYMTGKKTNNSWKRKNFLSLQKRKKEDRSSPVVIEPAEEGKSIAIFSNPEVRHLTYEAGQAMNHQSTIVTYKIK